VSAEISQIRESGTPPLRIALVLSGGGARGAYEAGVLSYLFDDLPARLGRPVHFDIVTGTSVGAVHACYVAAAQQGDGVGARLTALWRSLSLDRVYPAGPVDLVRVPWRLLGFGVPGTPLPATRSGIPERLPGLFDTSWLEQIVLREINWQALRRNIDDGVITALAVTATEIATGRSVVFIDRGTADAPPWTRDPFVVARPTPIGPAHTLASAAIPLVFPAIRIARTYYCDGGLRMNTPLVPALRLGADRVLVIGLRHPRSPEEEDDIATRREASIANPTYLMGKALNALLLDRIEIDVDRLRLFNGILESGVEHYGPDFLRTVNEPIVAYRGAPYRIVRELVLRPSRDLGALASECLAHAAPSRGVRNWLSTNVARFAARGAAGEADLLSYLFFDRCYAEHLIDLGRGDAAAATGDLVSFLS
jgi:NTE family protein